MRRLSLPLICGAAAAVVMCAPSPARADDGRAAIALAAIAVFDSVSLPLDVVWGVTGKKVDYGYGLAETILGGAQVTAGAIGLAVCASDPRCKKDWIFPALVVASVWTAIMTVHGSVVIATTPEPSPTSSSSTSSAYGSYPGSKPASLTPPFGSGPLAAPMMGQGLGAPRGMFGSGHGPSFTVAPIVGDAKMTPLGLGVVGTF
ncbi:MAG: hypothetical protein U0441_24175 [Polyangiaceae bacterium]